MTNKNKKYGYKMHWIITSKEDKHIHEEISKEVERIKKISPYKWLKIASRIYLKALRKTDRAEIEQIMEDIK